MARVLEHSARVAMPDWLVDVRATHAPTPAAQPLSFVANTHKLDEWVRIVETAPFDTELVLIDTDTMLLGSLDPVFEPSKDGRFPDISFTRKRNTSRFVLNGGVVVVRVTHASRKFMRAWGERNREFFRDEQRRAPYLATFGGINQSALGSLLEEQHDAHISYLDCAVWNACYEPLWQRAPQVGARVIHFKSHLRHALFGAPNARYFALVSKWKRIEKEALRAEQSAEMVAE